MMADSDVAFVFSKMLRQPDELTADEMVQMNSLLAAVTELFFRDCYLIDRAVFVECHSFIEIHGQRFFGNGYAQDWWRQNRPPTTYGLLLNTNRSTYT